MSGLLGDLDYKFQVLKQVPIDWVRCWKNLFLAVKLQKHSVVYDSLPDLQSAREDRDWLWIFGWTVPLMLRLWSLKHWEQDTLWRQCKPSDSWCLTQIRGWRRLNVQIWQSVTVEHRFQKQWNAESGRNSAVLFTSVPQNEAFTCLQSCPLTSCHS